MTCHGFETEIAAYLGEGLSRDEELEFRQHVEECEVCREALFLADPSTLFQGLGSSSDELVDDDPEDFLAGVRRGISLAESERLVREGESLRQPTTQWWRWSAAAAILIVGGLGLWSGLPFESGVPQTDAVVEVAAERPPIVAGSMVAGDRPALEELDLPDARVLQLLDDESTQVVMIVDQGLDI